MNNLDLEYQNLLKDILENGVEKDTRNGKTLSVFGRQIRYKFKDGKFPLLTTKKMYWKGIVTELLWFLRGDTNIKYLVDNDCHIWDGDAYKNWCKQFDVDPNNFDAEELVKGYKDQCLGYPLLENTSKEYKRGQINVYLEGKAKKPFFYLTKEEFANKIKTDDEFAQKWGELGPVYGAQWRKWQGWIDMKDSGPFAKGSVWYDQIGILIHQLKTNPDSRRLMVNAWNVGEISEMVLPPCHYGFQVYTRELSDDERYELCVSQKSKMTAISEEDYIKYNIPTRALSLMWNQRSVDTFLGLPFNIASYGLLLTMLADEVNMVPDQLIGNLGDTHIYLNHIEQAKEQIGREPYPLPTVHVRDGIFCSSVNDIILENYQSHPAIKAPLSN